MRESMSLYEPPSPLQAVEDSLDYAAEQACKKDPAYAKIKEDHKTSLRQAVAPDGAAAKKQRVVVKMAMSDRPPARKGR